VAVIHGDPVREAELRAEYARARRRQWIDDVAAAATPTEARELALRLIEQVAS
jgi:hypothetical protein